MTKSPAGLSTSEVWITGAAGLLGSYLLQTVPRHIPQDRLFGLTRSHLDLTRLDEVERVFARRRPGLVIHCAALSSTTACQASPAQARLINVEVPRLLSQLCARGKLIFFSSDLVFDGLKGHYVESDPPRPRSVYAETKLEAEAIILANPNHLVLRTSLIGGVSPSGHRAFNEQLRHAWIRGLAPTLFADEFRNPLPARMTAQAVWHLAAQPIAGLFHLAGAERLSRVDLARLLASRWPELKAQWRTSTLLKYDGPPRSPDTTLNCDKIKPLLPFPLPKLSHWLAEHPHEPF